MFHVLLALPALVTLGAMAVFVLSAPFCAGLFLQLVLTIFGQKRWVLYVPAGLGVLGLAGTMVWLLPDVPVSAVLVYWVAYFLVIWLTWLMVAQIKKAIVKWTEKNKVS